MLINISRLKPALLTAFCCGTFCIGNLVLQTTVSSSAAGQDALNSLQEPEKSADMAAKATAQQQQAQQQEALKKQMGDVLFKEVEKLVPGEQVEGSPAAESLHAAVDAIVLERKPNKALTILEQAVASNPEFPPAKLLMAGLSFAAKDQKNGLLLLREASINNLEHPAVYAAYGRLASGSGRSVDAMVHFEKLAALINQIQDKAVLAHYENEYLEGMSQTAVQLKQYDLARNLAEQLLKRKPDSTNPLQLLARISFDEGKLDEAVANLAKLRAKDPQTRAPEAVIGTWFARAGNQNQAGAWISKLPAAYPDDANVQLEYATWALGQEDIEGAAAAVAKAEAIEPATPAANKLKGKIAFYQRKYDDAVAIFKALHEANPRNAEIANMYVLSLIESSSAENKAIANQLATANLQANPKDRVTLAALGYVRLRTLGINDQLKSIFTKVAQTRDGRSPEVDYFLASFLKEAGSDQDALKLLQQASLYPGLFLYRKQADQMKQALAATVLPTP